MIVTIIIAVITYIAMIFFTKYRTPVAILGSSTLLIYGTLSNSFPANLAFDYFPKEIVILIFTLALFSKSFETIGVFEYIEKKLIDLSKRNRILLIVLLFTTMYLASMFMNNLSVILLFTFICIYLALKLKLSMIGILVGGLIVSNIGGAALPWADTPAVILTLYTDFNLLDFLTKVFLPCGLYIILIIIYTIIWQKIKDKYHKPIKAHDIKHKHLMPHELKPHDKKHRHLKPHELNDIKIDNPKTPIRKNVNRKHLITSVTLFVLFIIGVCIGPFINLSIAYVSMFFGALLLILNKYNSDKIINSLPILESLAFIIALFLIGGVLVESGIAEYLVNLIISLTNGNSILLILTVLYSAFLIATFFSAGPAAATLLPICINLITVVGNKLPYVALALGILAGSSMLPWSATGGPVMLSEVNRFLKQNNVSAKDKDTIESVFNLKEYIKFSIPFSFIMLFLSTFILIIYSFVF